MIENEDDTFSQSDLQTEDRRPLKRQRTSPRLAREVGLMRNIPGDESSGFVGSASGIYFIRSVYREIRHSHFVGSAGTRETEGDIVPGEDDRLISVFPDPSKQLWNEDEVARGLVTAVSFQDLVKWSGSYFANWHPIYPFLHAPTILGLFDGYSRSAQQQESPVDLQMVIIRSIMSISLSDRRQSSGVGGRCPPSLLFSSYDDAIDSLRYVLSHPTSLLGLQATLSVQLFLVSMLRLNAASRLGGLVIRMALQLGLHRCPFRYQSFSPSVRELRQRIFWSLYSIDRFICQSMGLPLGLHDDDVDVCYPLAESHFEGQPRELNQKLNILHLLARHATIRGEIIELRNKSIHYIQDDPDRATAITAKLTQWWHDVEDYSDANQGQGPSAYHITVLTLLRHESVISLHRPILAVPRQDAEYDAALQQCIGSARSIISTLYNAINKHDRSRNSEPLTLLWPSCTWAVWISTFILFYAAHGNHVAHKTVIRLTDKSLKILHHLSRRGSAWPDASTTAIQDLRARMLDSRSRKLAQTQGNKSEHLYDSSHSLASGPHASDISSGTGHDPTLEVNFYTPVGNNPQDVNLEPQMVNTRDNEWNDFMTNNLFVDQSVPEYDSLDLFSGFDIPFWFEQNQY